MSKSNINADGLDRFKAQPEYVRAVQFTDTPESHQKLSELCNGKMERVEHSTKEGGVMLHIELDYLSFVLPLNSWLIYKTRSKKWITLPAETFPESYNTEIHPWKKYPEEKPAEEMNNSRFKVFGKVNKGTEHEKETQFYAFWDGENFVDTTFNEDIEDVTHYYIQPEVPNPK